MTPQEVVLLATAHTYARTGTGREIRQEAGLSIEVVATAAGSSKAVLSRWERGLRMPRGEQAIKWAELLGDMRRAMTRAGAR
jgi:DNA-binding transcriptional regulator YiaG